MPETRRHRSLNRFHVVPFSTEVGWMWFISPVHMLEGVVTPDLLCGRHLNALGATLRLSPFSLPVCPSVLPIEAHVRTHPLTHRKASAAETAKDKACQFTVLPCYPPAWCWPAAHHVSLLRLRSLSFSSVLRSKEQTCLAQFTL